MEGILFDIKHCAIHDGPGIRTTLFFKGCPLHCWWCHNPESIVQEIQMVKRTKKLGDKEFLENTLIGREFSVSEVIKEIEKDRIFYEESGGGVTFSGGEPLMQPEFLKLLAQYCKESGIHTCLDTSGYASLSIIDKVLPYIDLFLFDIKSLDDNIHLKYTGVSNKPILKVLEYIREQKKEVVIRYPLIPGVNNSLEQLNKLKEYMEGKIREIHFLPFHKIASHKYKQLGMENKIANLNTLSGEHLEPLRKNFEASSFKVKIGG